MKGRGIKKLFETLQLSPSHLPFPIEGKGTFFKPFIGSSKEEAMFHI
jgi:hypothetical protein